MSETQKKHIKTRRIAPARSGAVRGGLLVSCPLDMSHSAASQRLCCAGGAPGAACAAAISVRRAVNREAAHRLNRFAE